MKRKLASIQEIIDLQSIPNADKIELATVEGWRAVVKKGQFRIGEKIIFCEPDSILPQKDIFSDFTKNGLYRIRTIKLRGCISQGIIFPLNADLFLSTLPIGTDITELLGITKYEKPISVQLRGRVRCALSRLAVPKTDETRVQNIPDVLERHKYKEFYITEKIDGASMSCYIDPETGLHVCSRNVDLAPDFEHKYNGNAYWKYATEHNLEEILKQLGNVALQGELYGENIQGNPLKLTGQYYRVFNIWDMTNHLYLDRNTMLDAIDTFGLGKDFLVPEIGKIILDHTVDNLLDMANGKSVLSNELREGLVFRPKEEDIDVKIGRLSFKAVSPKYLLKHGE